MSSSLVTSVVCTPAPGSARRRSPWVALSLVLLLTGLLLSGCGQPATEQQCREILRTAAELELREQLKGSSDEAIEEELAVIESRMEKPMMEQCVGKRISKRSLRCIREAKSSQELVDDCFR